MASFTNIFYGVWWYIESYFAVEVSGAICPRGHIFVLRIILGLLWFYEWEKAVSYVIPLKIYMLPWILWELDAGMSYIQNSEKGLSLVAGSSALVCVVLRNQFIAEEFACITLLWIQKMVFIMPCISLNALHSLIEYPSQFDRMVMNNSLVFSLWKCKSNLFIPV